MTPEEPTEADMPESPSITWRMLVLARAKAISREANERMQYLYRRYPTEEQDDSRYHDSNFRNLGHC